MKEFLQSKIAPWIQSCCCNSESSRRFEDTNAGGGGGGTAAERALPKCLRRPAGRATFPCFWPNFTLAVSATFPCCEALANKDTMGTSSTLNLWDAWSEAWSWGFLWRASGCLKWKEKALSWSVSLSYGQLQVEERTVGVGRGECGIISSFPVFEQAKGFHGWERRRIFSLCFIAQVSHVWQVRLTSLDNTVWEIFLFFL